MDLNRVMIIGRLTRDPELRSIPSGKSVATLGVATNRMYTDAGGQKQKTVEYHNVVLWSKLGEIANQYLKRGAKVYIEGRIQTREWTGQDGSKKKTTEIVGENMIMLDSAPRDGSHGASVASSNFSAPASVGEAIPVIQQEVIEEEIKVEDIPF